MDVTVDWNKFHSPDRTAVTHWTYVALFGEWNYRIFRKNLLLSVILQVHSNAQCQRQQLSDFIHSMQDLYRFYLTSTTLYRFELEKLLYLSACYTMIVQSIYVPHHLNDLCVIINSVFCSVLEDYMNKSILTSTAIAQTVVHSSTISDIITRK